MGSVGFYKSHFIDGKMDVEHNVEDHTENKAVCYVATPGYSIDTPMLLFILLY